MSILNKYKECKTYFKVLLDKYYDVVLSKDDTPSIPLNGNMVEKCLSSYIDFNNEECYENGRFYSLSEYTYGNAINNGCILSDIGFTGIDNGFISYEKDRISNKDFLDILTKSKFVLNSGDTRFFVSNVTGNTGTYSYDIEKNTDEDGTYYSLKGGFFQGFYKLFGFDYEVLPSSIDTEWNLEFKLKPMDYELDDNSLNSTHTGNEGIFFYIGTRAENKFSQIYGTSFDTISIECEENDYSCNDYIEDEIDLGKVKIQTSEGEINKKNECYDIETDNKFLTFDRTKHGFTTNNYEETQIFSKCKEEYEDMNLFLLMNRTKTGYTTNTLEKYKKGDITNIDGIELTSSTDNETYDISKDIKNNCFAIKINEDGSIGYRYLILNCDNENGYEMIEEKSFPNIIKKSEWNIINIKLKPITGSLDSCGNSSGKRGMKIYIYVNGYLKMISKELPEFNFRELNDTYEKQEGVPYSISIGGGTQGLCDSVWIDYDKPFSKVLPIEQNFAGTFIGDIQYFKFYTCSLQYNEIKNNYLFANGK